MKMLGGILKQKGSSSGDGGSGEWRRGSAEQSLLQNGLMEPNTFKSN